MAQENNIAQQLNDLLVTRGYDPELRDAAGNDGCEPKDAKLFKIDYTAASGKNYGTMVIILDVGNDLKAMFGNNLGRGMEDQDKNEWFEFQHQLSQFANKHRWTYTGDDISKLKYTMQGLAAIKEGLFEGYYGTRRISYAGEPTEARLMIRHNRNLGENDARFRYVESIFVETADGERYRLPFTNLAGGRAMLEHVRQGGKPYDVRGNHICEMITELKVLARFNRASQGRVVEGIKQGVVEGAQTYYKSLRESIKRLSSPRGYAAYFESWHPADITEQDQLVEDIKTLFIEQTIDDRIEQALPLLAKIQRGREMKEADIFENWVNTLAEGTWCLPETPEQLNRLKELMSSELIVGPDGTNATEQLHDLVGDDLLFDRISELAAQDARANLWDDSEVQARLQELGVQMPDRAEPDMDAQPQQAMAEDQLDEIGDTPAGRAALGAVEKRADDTRAAWRANPESNYSLSTPKDVIKATKATVAAGNRLHGFGPNKMSTNTVMARDASRQKQDMSEADNIAAFESLQRMRGLAGVPLKENVMNDSGSTLGHIIQTYQRDVRDFMQNNGDMSEHLYDALYDYYFDDMPYGVKKARTGDPYEWIGQRFYDDLQGADMVDENLGGIVGEAGAGAGQGNRGKPSGAIAYPVRPLNLVQTGEIPSPEITAIDLPDPLPMATLPNRAPVKGLDLTQGRPGRLDDYELPMASINPAPVKGLDLTQGRPGRLDDYEQQLEECNYTPLNEYCHVHGLKECWLEEMNQSILATGSRLIEDLDEDYGPSGPPGGKVRAMGTNIFKRGPKSTGAFDTEAGYFAQPEYRDATRSQADNDRAKRIRDWEKQTGQDDVSPEYNNQFRPIPPRTPTPRTPAAMAKPVSSAKITATDLPDEVDEDEDYGPSGPPGGKVRAMGTNIFKRGPKSTGAYDNKAGYFAYPEYRDATRSQADNDRAKRIRDWEKQTGQDDVSPEFHNQFRPIPPRTPTPQTSTAVAKPVPSPKITATDLPDKTDDQGRQYFHDYVIDTDGKQIPRIHVSGVGQTHDDSMDEGRPGLGAALRAADEFSGKAVNAVKGMIEKIPPGHPDYPLLQAARAKEQRNMNFWNKKYPETPWNPDSDADLLKSFNKDLNVQKGFGQFQRDAMPNDSAPTGYIRAQKSKGAAIDAENSMQGNQDLFKNAYGIDEDMTDVGDVVGQAARSVTNRLGQAASDMYEPIGNFVKGVKQGWNGKAQTAPDQPSAAVAMPVRSPDITTRDLPALAPGIQMVQNPFGPPGDLIPRIEVNGVGRKHNDPMDEADMMNPEIPKDFGSPEHLAHLAGLGKALQAGDRSALGKSNAALAAAQVGQGKTPWEPAPTPSLSTPGAAHDGQQGYDYQDEEPDQSDAETARLNRAGTPDTPNDRKMNDADWIMSQNPEEPKGRAHSGQSGYNYSDELEKLKGQAHLGQDGYNYQDEEPDQSDAETARLGRSLNYESREGDALLARIKSLALLR